MQLGRPLRLRILEVWEHAESHLMSQQARGVSTVAVYIRFISAKMTEICPNLTPSARLKVSAALARARVGDTSVMPLE